ncbi:MAG: hypothetical protein ACK4TK_12795 [Thiobacillaceae bacterium]
MGARLRECLHALDFIAAHRNRPQDFTRQRALPFATVVMWLLLNFQSSMPPCDRSCSACSMRPA